MLQLVKTTKDTTVLGPDGTLFFPSLRFSDVRQAAKFQCFIYFTIDGVEQIRRANYTVEKSNEAARRDISPQVYSLTMWPKVLHEGEPSLEVVCRISRGAVLTWKFNGQLISDRRSSIPFRSRIAYWDQVSGLMRLRNLRATDSGKLECCAESESDPNEEQCKEADMTVSGRSIVTHERQSPMFPLLLSCLCS